MQETRQQRLRKASYFAPQKQINVQRLKTTQQQPFIYPQKLQVQIQL